YETDSEDDSGLWTSHLFMMRAQTDENNDDLVPLEATNQVLDEIHQYEDSSQSILEWRLPSTNIRDVYRTSRFNFRSIIDISQSEATSQVSGTELETLDVPLIDMNRIRETLRRVRGVYNYIHIGLIQIGLVPLFHLPADSPVIAAVLDKRWREFRDQLISGI
ncbi:hypothetical protein, partial [Acinetobacter indicus]|uniref:hypothetical protein n=1 Tax=Acinetobacter indicus TaxID=756892 RepID=UPI001444024D